MWGEVNNKKEIRFCYECGEKLDKIGADCDKCNDSSINYKSRELKHINLIIPLLKLYEGVGIYCLKRRVKDDYIEELEDDLFN